MSSRRDSGIEVESINYDDYEILVIEYSDDDYPADNTYCFDIYQGYDLVYEGDRDFDGLYDAIDAAKRVIDDFELSAAGTVTDWYDEYGVNRSDFA